MPLPRHTQAYWPLIQEAAKKYALDAYLLAAIMDRESLCGRALTPEGPTGTGDNGNGLGLMQIDAREWPDFAAQRMPDGSLAWQDPARNIAKGASVLLSGFALAGSHFRPRNLHEAGEYGDALEMIAVAAYNAGFHRVFSAVMETTMPCGLESVLQACDRCTTGGDYATDVLRRRERFAAVEALPSPAPPPKPGVV